MREIIVRYNDGNDHMAVRGGEYVQDLVRCMKCKYARNIENEWICEHLSGMAGLNVLVNDDDFCSYGERRV